MVASNKAVRGHMAQHSTVSSRASVEGVILD